MELHLGTVTGVQLEMATDAVLRTATAKEVTAGQRLYGIVDRALLYAQDMAAVGQPLHVAPGRQAHPRRRLTVVIASPAGSARSSRVRGWRTVVGRPGPVGCPAAVSAVVAGCRCRRAARSRSVRWRCGRRSPAGWPRCGRAPSRRPGWSRSRPG